MKISVYLPCRAGSQRIINKNTRNFFGGQSLLLIKLRTLLKCKFIDEVCLSTNDEKVIKQSNKIKDSRLKIFKRKNDLCQSNTKTEDLVKDMLQICSNDILLWTHVTSPFLNSKAYEKIVNKFKKLKKNDSLMTVTKIKKFLWQDGLPLNYNRKKIKWPNTQNLNDVWEINSAAFVLSRKISEKYDDRIGKKPYLYELTQAEAFDIDWKEDFEIASILWARYGKI